jgi:hypothetical protein
VIGEKANKAAQHCPFSCVEECIAAAVDCIVEISIARNAIAKNAIVPLYGENVRNVTIKNDSADLARQNY